MGEKEAQYESKQGKIAVPAVRHKGVFFAALVSPARPPQSRPELPNHWSKRFRFHPVFAHPFSQPSLFSLIRPVFQYVSGLAIQSFANCLQGREANRFGLPVLRMERFDWVMPIFSANSPEDIFLWPSLHPNLQ